MGLMAGGVGLMIFAGPFGFLLTFGAVLALIGGALFFIGVTEGLAEPHMRADWRFTGWIVLCFFILVIGFTALVELGLGVGWAWALFVGTGILWLVGSGYLVRND